MQLEDRITPDGTLVGIADLATIPASPTGQINFLKPTAFRPLNIDTSDLLARLDAAPSEPAYLAGARPYEFTLPTPDGSNQRFGIVEAPVMSSALAAQFPDIQTFQGRGIDDPTANLRMDVTPLGFHAQVISSAGTWLIDPFYHMEDDVHVSYYRGDVIRKGLGSATMLDDVLHDHETAGRDDDGSVTGGSSGGNGNAARSGTQLRTYRLAVAATGEYTAFFGGTVPLGQASIVTAVNRVSGIYESELSIRLQLIANNSSLVYTNAGTDPYTNNDPFALLSENQANIDAVIGTANYDIGHVFTTGGGGLAGLGVVGNPLRKAQGETGLPAPVGDPYYVDYVAHEMGHQFGGNHSFNTASDPNRNAATAYEPGSGSTIMAYAGITGPDSDLQPNSDPFFNTSSFDEIIAFVDNVIPAVGTRTATGNLVPTVNPGPNFVIPARTPFVLTASGADANGDVVTYSWEQRDLGAAQFLSAADNGASPLFRVRNPTVDPSRVFPRLSDLVANVDTIPLGEKLPTVNRASMDFRVTARDNRMGGGGVNTADMKVQVVNTGAAFAITAPNSKVTWVQGTTETITWDVAGTTGNGINAATVNIALSLDGGFTYPIDLATGVPNNGSADVLVPALNTATARIRVQPVGNIFFDISNANFSISPVAPVFNVSGKLFEDWNGNGLLDAIDKPMSNRLLLIDTNGNGVQDSKTFSSGTINLAIPDAVFVNPNLIPGTVSTTISVGGLPANVIDVNVLVNITHTWDSDLRAYLTGPNNAKIALFLNVGSNGDNFSNTILDDEAATGIASGTPAFIGSFRPAEALSQFDGTPANGLWTLTMFDDVDLDTGKVVDWSLTFVSEATTTTGGSGFYGVDGLANGTYQIVPLLTGTNFINPASGAHPVTIASPFDSFNDRDFFTSQQKAFYGLAIDDLDKDGVFDAGEPGLPGVTIFIDANGNGAPDKGEATAVTDSLGRYQFLNRPAGPAVLRQIVPTGRVATLPASGKISLVQVGTESRFNNDFGSRAGIAPIITSDGGGTAATIAKFENGSAVTTVTGFDPDPGAVLTYSLAGGADAALFKIGTTTGVLTFAAAPNFESPTDAGANNQYELTVQVSDGASSGTQQLTVVVGDLNEAPVFVLGSNPSILEDAGPQSAPFLTGIQNGPNPEPGQTVAFFVSVTGTTGTVSFTSAPTIDASGVLSYTVAPNANGTATVSVFAKDSGGTLNGGTDTSATKSFTIAVAAVNDAPTFTLGADPTADEDAGLQTRTGFIVAKSTGPPDESSQTISYALSNDNSSLFAAQPAIAANGTLTFTAAANASGKAVVTVTAKDSGGIANGGVDASAPQTFTITIGDINDAPSFAVGAAQSLLEDAPARTVPGFLASIAAGPPSESAQTVSFVVTNSNAALFAVAPAIDPSGQLTYALAPNANGTAKVTVVAKDSGGTANGGIDSSAAQFFTITATAVNDVPSFALGAPQSSNEDAGAQIVPAFLGSFAAGPADEASQILSFLVSNDNPSLFLVQPSIDAAGKLSYFAKANANGSATVTVVAKDTGGVANGGTDTSAPQTFAIAIDPVNDAPAFALGTNQNAMGDSGPLAVPNFATLIAAGPADEAGQTVAFQVVADNPSLFSVQPAIDAFGQLTYTPAPLTNGVSTVTVIGTDDGGTANGGVDQSSPRTFTVGITSFLDPVASQTTTLEDTLTPTGVALDSGLVGSPVTHFRVTDIRNGILYRGDGTTFVSDGDFIPVSEGAAGLKFLPFSNRNDATNLGDFGFSVQNSSSATTAGLVRVPVAARVSVTPVNDPPSFSATNPPPVSEDVGFQAVSPFALNAVSGPPSAIDESVQIRTFRADIVGTTDGLTFVQGPVVDSNGILYYRPTPNSFGTATVRVTLDDGSGGTASADVTIVVNPVNDAPTATVLTPVVPAGGAAPQVVPGVLRFSNGAANEPEPVTVSTSVVESSGNVVFLVPPSIDANGTLTYTPRRAAIGTVKLAVNADDGSAAAPTRFVTVNVDATGRYELVGYREFAAGTDDGKSNATFYNPDGSVRFLSAAFPGTEFGARVAAADFTGDGVADLVVGLGVGTPSAVQVVDGVTQKAIFDFKPFEPSFTGGIFVAAGDVTGDRIADIVISPDRGGGPRVRVIDGSNFQLIADFFGIDDPNFRGGARTAIGDLNSDGVGDLVVAAGFSGGPRVAAFNGLSLSKAPVKLFNDFFAFEQTLRNGIYVAVGDIDGDGIAEIVAGGGPGGAPRVAAFSGRDLTATGGPVLTLVTNFFAGDTSLRGGVRVSVKDLDGDTNADLVVGSGEGAGSRVTAYLGKVLVGGSQPSAAFAFDAFEDFVGGVYVG